MSSLDDQRNNLKKEEKEAKDDAWFWDRTADSLAAFAAVTMLMGAPEIAAVLGAGAAAAFVASDYYEDQAAFWEHAQELIDKQEEINREAEERWEQEHGQKPPAWTRHRRREARVGSEDRRNSKRKSRGGYRRVPDYKVASIFRSRDFDKFPPVTQGNRECFEFVYAQTSFGDAVRALTSSVEKLEAVRDALRLNNGDVLTLLHHIRIQRQAARRNAIAVGEWGEVLIRQREPTNAILRAYFERPGAIPVERAKKETEAAVDLIGYWIPKNVIREKMMSAIDEVHLHNIGAEVFTKQWEDQIRRLKQIAWVRWGGRGHFEARLAMPIQQVPQSATCSTLSNAISPPRGS
jgi:hypothetical protein